MQVGDLVKFKGDIGVTRPSPLFLILDIIAHTTLVVSLQTNHKMWGDKAAYEVISESR